MDRTCFLWLLASSILLSANGDQTYTRSADSQLTNGNCSCCGRDGRDGKDGRDGVSFPGSPGRDGRDGKDGKDCVECARGPIGPVGKPGETGAPGERGASGPQGEKGEPGPTGKDGQMGPAGQPGVKGDKGDTGDKGICDQAVLDKLLNDVKDLQNKLTVADTKILNLESSSARLVDGKLPQGVLPGSYAQYTLEQVQWLSLHMAAAAACRGLTASGGSGPWANAVLARETAQTCTTVCARTVYAECDGEVSLHGKLGQVNSYGDPAGFFYNYNCGTDPAWGDEVKMSPDASITQSGGYVSYCCCRNP